MSDFIQNNNTAFLLCECEAEAILLKKYFNIYSTDIYISIFKHNQYKIKPTFRERLRYCFQILKTGKYNEDQIIIDINTANKLGNWLIENTKQ